MAQATAKRLVTEARLSVLVFTSVIVWGATGDGVTDDTAAFVAAIASGAKTIFVPDGTYIVNGLLMNVASQTMLLSPGATLKAKTGGSQTIVEITGASAALVGVGYGATIDGNSVGSTAGSSVYTHVGGDHIVQGLNMINCAGLAINTNSDRVLIDNNTITNSGSTAIYLQNGTGVNLLSPTVSGNRISITTGSGVQYGIQSHVSGAQIIYRPRFFNNDVTLLATATSGIGIELYGGNSFGSVVGNTVEGSNIGISIDSGPSITVTGNSVHGAYSYGIEFASATLSTCSGNSIDGNALTSKGVSISNTAGGHNAVTGNTISNLLANNSNGIHAQNVAGAGTVISGNNITCYQPVVIGGQSGQSITGNVLTCVGTGTLCGVSLDTVTNAVVANNTITGATTGAVNVFTGTMAGLVIGPNILLGGSVSELLNGWTPGTSGTGSRLIRGNSTTSNPTSPTVTASPYTYTNTSVYTQIVHIYGGTVSSITRSSTVIATSTAGAVTTRLDPGDAVAIVYTVAPTLAVDRK